MDKHSNSDATKKYLGYVYQVLIAIDKCLSAKENQTIWIECYGDIFDGHTYTEVKSHIEKKSLSNTSTEFWNTLKNLVEQDTSYIKEIVLHTTSHINEDTIFYGWNELSSEKKFERIKNVEKIQTIKSSHDIIFNEKEEVIIEILGRMIIHSSMERIEDMWNKLINSRGLTSRVDPEHRENILHWIYSYVNKRAISNNEFWQVDINDFDEALLDVTKKFNKPEYPFPYYKKDTEIVDESRFYFIKEYRDIQISKSTRGRIVSDYLRTKKSEAELVVAKPDIMPEIIEIYSDQVVDRAKSHKEKEGKNIRYHELGSSVEIEICKNAYYSFDCSNLIQIPDVSDTAEYFMKGTLHSAINRKLYTWRYTKDDCKL
ncbi:hypothetical protein RBG15_003073 [Vibrio metoecus]